MLLMLMMVVRVGVTSLVLILSIFCPAAWARAQRQCLYSNIIIFIIEFRVSRRQQEMYNGHPRLCVCDSVCLWLCVSVCLSAAACPHYCTDPDVTWTNGRGCPLVVQCLADLQPVHGFRCYDDIAQNAKCQRVLVLVLRLVFVIVIIVMVFAAACYAINIGASLQSTEWNEKLTEE